MEEIEIRVMIVEDEEVRKEYRRLIPEYSMLRLVAESGNQEEALKILEEVAVDVLILDLEIKNGSGILLLEKLQRMKIEKPFIMVVTNVISKDRKSVV